MIPEEMPIGWQRDGLLLYTAQPQPSKGTRGMPSWCNRLTIRVDGYQVEDAEKQALAAALHTALSATPVSLVAPQGGVADQLQVGEYGEHKGTWDLADLENRVATGSNADNGLLKKVCEYARQLEGANTALVTGTNINTCAAARDAFEQWARSKRYNTHSDPEGRYESSQATWAWDAWQAATLAAAPAAGASPVGGAAGEAEILKGEVLLRFKEAANRKDYVGDVLHASDVRALLAERTHLLECVPIALAAAPSLLGGGAAKEIDAEKIKDWQCRLRQAGAADIADELDYFVKPQMLPNGDQLYGPYGSDTPAAAPTQVAIGGSASRE